MASREQLHAEITALLDEVLSVLGTGTLMLPEPIQRAMAELTTPSLDEPGLIALRDDLAALRPG